MSDKPSRQSDYFEQLYQQNSDPWNFATSEYERQKYDSTLAMLAGRRFRAGFEVGCSIGILTHRLAALCGTLLAVDVAAQALEEAGRRCAHLPHVSLAQLRVPEDWPDQQFDLIVLSEMLYFLVPADIRRVATQAQASLLPDGLILLVNYTEPTEEPTSGDEAAEIFISACLHQLPLLIQKREEKFRIDLLRTG